MAQLPFQPSESSWGYLRLLTSPRSVRDCDAVALPNSSSVHRGVTLLELLIVLTLMGIAATLVVPALARPVRAPEAASDSLVASARRTAIRRAEPLRVRVAPDGAWDVVTQRNGAVIDSGHVQDSLPALELLLDALGGCVPVARTATAASYDPLTCASTRTTVRP